MDDRLTQLHNDLNALKLQVDGARMGTKAMNTADVFDVVISILQFLKGSAATNRVVATAHQTTIAPAKDKEGEAEAPTEEKGKVEVRQKENPLLQFEKDKLAETGQTNIAKPSDSPRTTG